eukprot:gene6767-7477_t
MIDNAPDTLCGVKRKIEEEQEQDDPSLHIRSRQGSSLGQPFVTNAPNGLYFVSVMNHRKRFFLPSTKNTFHGIKARRLLSDSGCSSVLLPIDDIPQLENIFKVFSNEISYISRGKGVDGDHLSLVFYRLKPTFEVKLCSDILTSPTIYVDKIRFSLCTEDMSHILANYPNSFVGEDIEVMQRMVEKNSCSKRRSHGLVGQDILSQFCSLKLGNIQLYVDPRTYSLPPDFSSLALQMRNIFTQIEMYPEGFHDWEDDEFSYEDDEYIYED